MGERSYVLGTHDDEIARLALQHAVWRPQAMAAWQRAGIAPGARVVDAGCGPGFASLNLAEMVGPGGLVHAFDRSHRFLDHLRARGIPQIEAAEADIACDAPPALDADMAWCRWVLCFAPNAAHAVAWLAGTLKRGGQAVIHEYFDYAMWRTAPRSAVIDAFVASVMTSWRAAGGEPDIARDLPPLLAAAGLEITDMRPLVFAATPRDFVWQWPASFIRSGSAHLLAQGAMSEAGRSELLAALDALEAGPGTFMITPGVLEITAMKR